MQKYAGIARQILQSNDLSLYNQFVECVMNPIQLPQILDECRMSQELLFVTSQVIIKKILANEYINADQDLQITENNKLQAKKNCLILVIQRVWEIVNTVNMSQHVYRSLLNAIAVCLKCLSQLPFSKQQFIENLLIVCPNFVASVNFCNSNSETEIPQLIYPQSNENPHLPPNHEKSVQILNSLLDYKTTSAYFTSYYLYRRHIYQFRTSHLAFMLNFAIQRLKIIFMMYNRLPSVPNGKRQIWSTLHPTVSLLEKLTMYPFTLRVHQSEHEDEVHDNVAGLQTQIYFPSYFRGFLCDTGLLFDLSAYLITLFKDSVSVDEVREEINLLIRILGRCISTTDYLFYADQERINFRKISIEMLVNILAEEKYYDQYYFMCITKIAIKVLVAYGDKDYGSNKQFFFEALTNFMKNSMIYVKTSIEDGQKNQIRLIFDMLTAMLHNSNNEVIQKKVEYQSQQILHLFFQKMLNNSENDRMIEEFGTNNSQQVQCFQQIFNKIPEVFNLKLVQNLNYLRNLDFSTINKSSLTFWLHLCALLLPQNDTSKQQTQLILKFFHASISARSIASLHYINTLIGQLLQQVEDGISTTYLWKFMEQSLKMGFQQFLTQIIKYTINIFTIPNYTLIQNGLELFKTLFLKLCKLKHHRSFKKYFAMVEQVSQQIDGTMLVHPDYVKLRINFFSVISIIWISQNQLSFLYKIVENIRKSLGNNNDLLHFMRYLIDITGVLQPVQSTEVFIILVELIINDFQYLLPMYLGSAQKIRMVFGQEQFLRVFMRFILQLINDHSYRLSSQTHTDLGIRIQQIFKPYILEAVNYDYPKKTVQIYQKFLKLNPLGELLPFRKQFKQKNPSLYKLLLREYFQNLHRVRNQQEFYFMYSLIQDNVQLMSQWWEQIIVRNIYPNIDVTVVIQAKIWNTSRQKQNFGKMLYRIARYSDRYWRIQQGFNSQSQYAKWFVQNCQ